MRAGSTSQCATKTTAEFRWCSHDRPEDDREGGSQGGKSEDGSERGVEAMTNDDDDTETGPPDHLGGVAGMDLVRRTLEEGRGAGGIQGKAVGRGRRPP